jgi:hypothetical protein
MVVVTGREPSVLVAVADALSQRGTRARVAAVDEDLFECIYDTSAKAVVVVDALPHLEGGAEPPALDFAWADVLRAARSPKRPRVVLCTARTDGPEARDLRRSGIAYVIVQAATLVTAIELGVTPGQTVHLARDLPIPDLGLTPFGTLIDAVVRACDAPELAGRIVDVRQSSWADVVAGLGARPKTASRTMTNVLRWLGRPAVTSLPAPQSGAR